MNVLFPFLVASVFGNILMPIFGNLQYVVQPLQIDARGSHAQYKIIRLLRPLQTWLSVVAAEQQAAFGQKLAFPIYKATQETSIQHYSED